MADEAGQRAAVEQDAGVGKDDDLARGAIEPGIERGGLAGPRRQGVHGHVCPARPRGPFERVVGATVADDDQLQPVGG